MSGDLRREAVGAGEKKRSSEIMHVLFYMAGAAIGFVVNFLQY